MYELKPFKEYFVSNTGEIFNKKGKRLKTEKKRYERILLKRKHFSIHRIVAELFIPNPFNYPIVRHLDNNTFNNTIENLQWGTHKDNEQDKKNHGTYMTRCTKTKLSKENLEEILKLKQKGFSGNKIAKEFNVSRQTINNFLSGKTWMEFGY